MQKGEAAAQAVKAKVAAALRCGAAHGCEMCYSQLACAGTALALRTSR